MIKTQYKKALCVAASALILTACNNSEPTTSVAQKVEAPNALATAKISSQLPHYLERDIRDEVFYFVMPDRFLNGDPSNDQGSKTKPESFGGFDPTSKGHFHGGDLAGLKEKLPYLQEMGITAIWMTPIMRNQAVQRDSSGYHGYWVLDFNEIDPHLGSNEELVSLIDAAHELNIKVFFDIIANHSADVIQFDECHGKDGKQWLGKNPELCDYRTLEQVANGEGYTVRIPEGKENIKYPAWLNDPKYYHNQGDSTWQGESAIYGDFAGLDDIDTDNPEVVKGMIDIFKEVVSEFKPDGFRIDTVKHVNIEFWSEFAPAIVDHAASEGIPQFFMFGEVYDSNPKVLSKFTTEGNMQSVLDFGIQSAIYKTMIERQGTDALTELFANDVMYKDHDSDASLLVNFTGNHDMGRFNYMLGNSKFDMTEDEKLARIQLSNAIMYFSRGIPVIYYGDEQGFVGDGGDKGSRQDMMPSLVPSYNDDDLLGTDKTTADSNFDQDHVLYQNLVELSNVYAQHKALRQGKQTTVYSQNTPGLFAMTKDLGGEQYVVVFNTANSEQTQALDLSLTNYKPVVAAKSASEQGGKLTITAKPLSYAIYKATK